MTHLDLSKYRKSSAGTTVDETEENLEVIRDYSFLGHLLLWTMGTTVYPIEIKFKCKKTGEVFETLSRKEDFERLDHYMLYHRR